VLRMADALGCKPASVVIIGVEPKTMEVGLELSPELQACVQRVVELALREAQS